MTDKEFFDRVLEVSTEFDKYVLSHPEVAEKIPPDALVVFILKDEPEFNQRAIELAHQKRASGQPIVKVEVERLLPLFESRLVNPQLKLVSSI
jgi:hypothetical protein